MEHRSRREWFGDVGKGMFVAGLGASMATDLGLAPAWAKDGPGRLTFGELESLVGFMQETPWEKLVSGTVEKLRSGTELKKLVAAAALANARAFGGEDYIGFHTLMALAPAYHMAGEEKQADRRPLAVLKVLVRNAQRLAESGADHADVLKPVDPASGSSSRPGGEQLREQVRKTDLEAAERTFAAQARGSAADALNDLMFMVDDATEVHRTVLVSRAWEMLDFVGVDKAHTMLRQSVHYCIKSEKSANHAKSYQGIRDLMPKLLDQHKLLGRLASARTIDDNWIETFADTLFKSTPDQAASAAAAALAEGIPADAIADAIALVANQLVLRDEGRIKAWTSANKPVGSVHGDSIGVHASDTANAWRNLARAGDQRTRVTSTILAAYQVARDRSSRGAEFLKWEPYPRPEHRELVRSVAADALPRELATAIKAKDQVRSAAIAHRLGEEKASAADVFAILRQFAVSEDGALHAEKYYRTTSTEYAQARPTYRWRQLVALARVMASGYGYAAPGYAEACRALGVTEVASAAK